MTHAQDFGDYTSLTPELNLVSIAGEAKGQLLVFLAGAGIGVVAAILPLGVQLLWASRRRRPRPATRTT